MLNNDFFDDAIYWDGTNFEEIKNFCYNIACYTEGSDKTLVLGTAGYKKNLWIFRFKDNSYFVVTNKDLDDYYRTLP